MKRVLAAALLSIVAGCPKAGDERPIASDAGVHRTPPDLAPAGDTIVYRLGFDARAQHLVDVEMSVPSRGRDTVTLMMPTWTPGSYLVREFARHVEGFEAFGPDGTRLPVKKVEKNRWAVAAAGAPNVRLRYRVYARELTVRTSFVDAEYALLTGTSIFFADADHLDAQHRVEVEVPKNWKTVLTSLTEVGGSYVADHYDLLVDAPFMIGNPEVFEIDVDGVPHVLANLGGAGAFDGERAKKDVEKIARAHIRLFGGAPYDRYVFMNVLSEGRGGLEHQASTVLMTSRFVTRDDEAYRGWLGLVSHELFHAWNGKRLRPAVLGPFDYEQEAYTTDLWFVEGFTSYYDDLLVARAGLLSDKQWVAALSRNIEATEARPGKHHQSLARASYDAWIKFYRADENSNNSSVSYYTKGAVVAFLLDAFLRERTRGKTTLDDVMREAWRRLCCASGYTTEALMEVVEDAGGADARAFLEAMVSTTEPLDYRAAFRWYGLRFSRPKAEGGASRSGWLGVNVERRGAGLVVTEVVRGGPAYEAGVNVEDELIAIGEDRIADLAQDLKGRPPGTEVELLVSRRRRLRRIPVVLGEPLFDLTKVELLPERTGAARRNLEALLTPR